MQSINEHKAVLLGFSRKVMDHPKLKLTPMYSIQNHVMAVIEFVHTYWLAHYCPQITADGFDGGQDPHLSSSVVLHFFVRLTSD